MTVRRPAQAQATDALVANTGQTKVQAGMTLTSERVQAFTTGSNAEGYTLTGIDFHFHTATRIYLTSSLLKTLKASVWTSGGTTLSGTGTINDLGTKLADLEVPTIETTGVVTFAAPSGTTLAASTTYYVVIGSGDFDDDTHLLLSNTTSDDEDTAGPRALASRTSPITLLPARGWRTGQRGAVHWSQGATAGRL